MLKVGLEGSGFKLESFRRSVFNVAVESSGLRLETFRC